MLVPSVWNSMYISPHCSQLLLFSISYLSFSKDSDETACPSLSQKEKIDNWCSFLLLPWMGYIYFRAARSCFPSQYLEYLFQSMVTTAHVLLSFSVSKSGATDPVFQTNQAKYHVLLCLSPEQKKWRQCMSFSSSSGTNTFVRRRGHLLLLFIYVRL